LEEGADGAGCFVGAGVSGVRAGVLPDEGEADGSLWGVDEGDGAG
jgi:hypothetical protein